MCSMNILTRSLLVIILAHRNVCASTSVICRQGTNCECSVDEPCHLECIGDYQCTGGNTLTCRPSQPCVLRCEGEQACANSTLIPNGASSVSVECIGENACDDTEIVRESNDSRSLTINSGCVLSHTSSDPTAMPSVSPTLVPTAVPTVIPTATTTLQLFVPTTSPTPSPVATQMPITTASPTASPGSGDAKGKSSIADIIFTDNYKVVIGSWVVSMFCVFGCFTTICRGKKSQAAHHAGDDSDDSDPTSDDNMDPPAPIQDDPTGRVQIELQLMDNRNQQQRPVAQSRVSSASGYSEGRPARGIGNNELLVQQQPVQQQVGNGQGSISDSVDGSVHEGSVRSSVDEQYAQVLTGRFSQDETPRDTDIGAV